MTLQLPLNYYFRLLGISPSSDRASVREAYQRLAMVYHPDRNPAGEQLFKNITDAYQKILAHFDENNIASKELVPIDQCRRQRRGSRSERRFEIVLEGHYIGTSVQEQI
ncbi:MAG: J domain-containing protein [Oleibacter sp.]|nr:J domain-containing protein [Thalassolituus sp.]